MYLVLKRPERAIAIKFVSITCTCIRRNAHLLYGSLEMQGVED